MANNFKHSWHFFAFLLNAVFLSIIAFLPACSEDDEPLSESRTGSIAFNVEWKDESVLYETKNNNLAIPRIASFFNPVSAIADMTDCNEIQQVRAKVFDSSNSLLATGGPWACSSRQGTVSNVPVGSNRKVVVYGDDLSGNVLYQGEETGLTVSPGQTTNIKIVCKRVGNLTATTTTLSAGVTTTTTPTATDNQPPTAKITSPFKGASYNTNNTIYFNATGTDSDGTIASYSWTFGDNETGSGNSPSHAYKTQGTYTVTVTVADNLGATAKDSISITISDIPTPLPDEMGMIFERIPAGGFMMGPDPSKIQRWANMSEFYMQQTEMTQGQWMKIMGNNPSNFSNCGDDCPVENITWYDIQDLINKLNDKDSKYKYDLPTEAQWEYACRAGTSTKFYFGDDETKLKDHAWYLGTPSNKTTHPVKQKKPNSWGLYDMYGNVREWCKDAYVLYCAGCFPNDPYNTMITGKEMACRGGSYRDSVESCQSASDIWPCGTGASSELGFRLIRKPK